MKKAALWAAEGGTNHELDPPEVPGNKTAPPYKPDIAGHGHPADGGGKTGGKQRSVHLLGIGKLAKAKPPRPLRLPVGAGPRPGHIPALPANQRMGRQADDAGPGTAGMPEGKGHGCGRGGLQAAVHAVQSLPGARRENLHRA